MRPLKIISGGQTGADCGGLDAAVLLGIETGGVAPRGYRTEAGPNPNLARLGLTEHSSPEYPPRTAENVRESDCTIIFDPSGKSRGSALTRDICLREGKPFLVVRDIPNCQFMVRDFINWYEPKVLNVAGNRESTSRGIQEAVRDALMGALGNSDLVLVPSLEMVESIEVGALAPTAFGRWDTVAEVVSKGVDVNGKAFAVYLHPTGTKTGRCSMSIKEGEAVHSVGNYFSVLTPKVSVSTSCCGARWDEDLQICPDCKDHASPVWYTDDGVELREDYAERLDSGVPWMVKLQKRAI